MVYDMIWYEGPARNGWPDRPAKSFGSKNKFWFEKKISNKYKDQNDRNANIYRCKTSPDHFVLTIQLK